MSPRNRWPSSSTAAHLYDDARGAWPELREEVMDALAARPYDAVMFVLLTLNDIRLAWEPAHSLALEEDRGWQELAKAHVMVDPLAVLP